MRLRHLGTTAALIVLGSAQGALAQDDCEDPVAPGPVEFTPAPGGPGGVMLNAPVKVRYTDGFFEGAGSGIDPETALFVYVCDEPVLCADGLEVTGDVTLVGDVLVFQPDGLWEPRTSYGVVATGIGAFAEFSFETGTEVDTQPPQLGGMSVGSSRVGESCEAPDGGYRIDVQVQPATDDGPRIDIEYLVYLTRGPEVEAPELRARARQATDVIPMAFILEASEAVSPICVTVHAVDGVGNVDDDTEPTCFDPIQGNFFEPLCSASAISSSHAGAWPVPVALLALAFAARRRRGRA